MNSGCGGFCEIKVNGKKFRMSDIFLFILVVLDKIFRSIFVGTINHHSLSHVMCVSPKRYGMSAIFLLLTVLLFVKFNSRGDLRFGWRSRGICTQMLDSIVIVVSPLSC